MLVLLLYIVVFVPIAICFEYEPHPAFITVDLLVRSRGRLLEMLRRRAGRHDHTHTPLALAQVDTAFLVDIGLNFRTGYHDAAGLLVMDRARITRRYGRGWFTADAVSSVPMHAITLVLRASGVNDGGSLVAMKMVRGLPALLPSSPATALPSTLHVVCDPARPPPRRCVCSRSAGSRASRASRRSPPPTSPPRACDASQPCCSSTSS